MIEIGGTVREQLDPAARQGARASRSSTRTCPCSPTSRSPRTSRWTKTWVDSPGRSRRLGCAASRPSSSTRLGFALPLEAPVSSLPIASRQIVAIAAGSAAQARLLFMDEPTASLTRSEVETAARHRRPAEGRRHRGGVRHPPARRGGRDRRARHGHARRPQGRHLAGARSRRPPHRRADDRASPSTHASRRATARRAPPVLEVAGLTRRGEYEDVSFALRRGEILGLTGLLGAGRTELALSLFGMTRAGCRHDPARRTADRAPVQPGRDPRRHRLCPRGPAEPRPRHAPIGRRQSGAGRRSTGSPTASA